MDSNKSLKIEKKSFIKRIFNKVKNLFKREQTLNETKIQVEVNENENEKMRKKRDFLDSIRIEDKSEIVYLKIKLENGEIKAIDLTDEQIDKLQKIYDKEIEEKKNKIIKLKNIA